MLPYPNPGFLAYQRLRVVLRRDVRGDGDIYLVRVRGLNVPLRINARNVLLFLLGVFAGSQIGVLFTSLKYWLLEPVNGFGLGTSAPWAA